MKTVEVECPQNPLVVLGHPGHELRIHGWLGRWRPQVWAMTDGSGSQGKPRTHLSVNILRAQGATPGPCFGRWSDQAVYNEILATNAAPFVAMADEVCQALLAGGHDALVSDSAEGYNPSHDLCHLIASAAVRRARAISDVELPHFDFPLEGDPRRSGTVDTGRQLQQVLDDAATDAKVDAAIEYARTVDGTLLGEVEAALERFGRDLFAHEILTQVEPIDYATFFGEQKPFYETHGEKRAQSGTYRDVIRHQQHMVPLATALASWAKN